MKPTFLSKVFQAALMCCLAVILSGCDDFLANSDNPTGTTLIMNTGDATLKVGEQLDRPAITNSPAYVLYSSSDPAVATVGHTGTVTAIAPGTATITAHVQAVGNYAAASASYKVIVEDTSSPSTPIVVTTSTPLTIEALEAGATVTFKALNSAPARDIEYSKDDGATWTAGNTGGSGVSVVLAKVGNRVMFRGENTNYATGGNDDYNHIGCDKNIKVCGNIMSLIQKTGFETLTALTAANAFKKLFMNNVNLIDASDLLLPAETLTNYCYNYMFYGCANLTAAPKEMPATTVAEDCYSCMFQGCTELTTVPVELPATVMKEWCYSSMFNGCTKLTTAPKLPATTLANRCYAMMFNGCTSLNEVWVKTGYDSGACLSMFTGCTNASTSTFHTDGVWSAWKTAFANIDTWNNAAYTVVTTSTPLTIEALEDGAVVTFNANDDAVAKDIEYSTDGGATWTAGNTGGTGVSVPLANAGDKVMFRGENAAYATSLSTQYNKISSTKNIKVYGNIMSLIQKTGFETLTALTGTNTFKRLFKDNVKLIDASNLLLPATTLTYSCYRGMFQGCANLTTAPNLPATSLAGDCYNYMFYSCTKLTTAPKLPATTLVQYCYSHMFYDCTSLTEAWVKANYSGVNYECLNMFNGCTNASTSTFHTDGDWSSWTTAFANINTWTYATYTPAP